MLTRLHLKNFKNFPDETLRLGPLTILVGTNAAGKSNIRDAFRFLNGIGRGYNLAEIFGAKYGDSGEKLWEGIRGGTREAVYKGGPSFTLGTEGKQDGVEWDYRIEISIGTDKIIPTVTDEKLDIDDISAFSDDILADRKKRPRNPLLSHIKEPHFNVKMGNRDIERLSWTVLDSLQSMRFFDLHPEAMREPSFPGQDVLGDQGHNLSSVLQAICQEERGKAMLVSWLQALTPMDAVDFEFQSDPIGRIIATLVEADGQRTTLYSASDGTLRFLAMIAALLGPKTAKLYFFEELDNGIHPTRLHLLLQLLEQAVAEGRSQIVATTHSPALLRLLSPQSLEAVSIIYRSPESSASRIVRLLDLPEIKRLLPEQDLDTLFESGWLEDAIAFQNTPALEPAGN